MADFTLVIGNKNYSSWSLRGWCMARIAASSRGARDTLDLPKSSPRSASTRPPAACRCCCIADWPSGSRWRSAIPQ